jgi:molybdopterin-guanine dinucleotide biosynthesis protein A
MGCDKALLPLPGLQNVSSSGHTSDIAHQYTPFLAQQASILSVLCPHVVLVVRDHEQADLYAPYLPSTAQVVLDQQPDIGPLMGLYSGLSVLAERQIDCALVTAVDAPLLQSSLARWLLTQASEREVIMPIVDGIPQVLLAVYPRAVLPQIEQRLREGRRDPRSLLQLVPVRSIEEAQLRQVDPELRSFLNVNTPEEFSSLPPLYTSLHADEKDAGASF